ncbi:MAG TPA: excinuclease ABC subunit UvrA [Clostridiaceae bacterium]|nr:excinuclease ABC subunit UvrA [Clostridiaceae bacterium]
MDSQIQIRGAREHNLRNIDVDIPRNKLVVLTGISGSGKSSLAFDTIYAEGQRRYVESLSSYARQFLGQMEKPAVDQIDGLSPAIAIDQKTTSKNPRSTVGTVTEIYDYLRLLYARVGTMHCPVCGRVIQRQSIDQIIGRLSEWPERTRMIIMAPVVRGRKGEFTNLFKKYWQEGFVRVRVDGEFRELEEDIQLELHKKHDIEIVVDRLLMRPDITSRLAGSIETALGLTEGLVLVHYQLPRLDNDEDREREGEVMFSARFSCPDCDIDIDEISPRSFSFNNPFGACPTCFGIGELREVNPDLIVADEKLSLNEGAIMVAGWRIHEKNSWGRAFIEALAKKYDFSLDTPFQDLPTKIKDIILFGDNEKLTVDTRKTRYPRNKPHVTKWQGIVTSVTKRWQETSSDEMKAYYEDYLSITTCPVCQGARLKKESLAVTCGGLNIYELTMLPIGQTLTFLENISWAPGQILIAETIMRELEARLRFLVEVGLHYLTLARAAATLSGGEAQRIRLATQIGSGLMGVLYILDEPSIGLHQRDNNRLLSTLKTLRDLGNTVIVVEHDEETIWEADHVIDIGPGAGELGGKIVATGRPDDIANFPDSLTGQYMSGRRMIPIPAKRREPNTNWLYIKGAHENNLKNLDVKIPLGLFTCVTGVSGSGKSSLVLNVILNVLAHKLNRARKTQVKVEEILGLEHLDKVIAIDQSPIGRTPRSNPATYTGVFDYIRELFSQTREARARGYKPGRFSFNVKGGRCEACYGDGVNKIEMHFLPDVYVKCDVCQGRRYNRETLEVKYGGKTIADILDMTVEEALRFFAAIPRIANKLKTLFDVGLGYIRLGQSSTELSGGEAQRVKLASELSRRSSGRTFYILDEPTTGLHAADVHRLTQILQRLVAGGNTVVVIEHNLDVIKTADWIIDLGPEGGDGGGEIVVTGTPEDVALYRDSYTGQYLAQILVREIPPDVLTEPKVISANGN